MPTLIKVQSFKLDPCSYNYLKDPPPPRWSSSGSQGHQNFAIMQNFNKTFLTEVTQNLLARPKTYELLTSK